MPNMVEINPTLFNQYASNNSEIWNLIIGSPVVHRIWGQCRIEKIDLTRSLLFVNGRRVALSYFQDGIFSGLMVAADIAESVMNFQEQKNEMERKRKEEEEQRKQLEAEERERLVKAQFQTQIIERERRAKLRGEEELRRIKEKESRADSIQSFCAERGIKKLIHFTRLNNLKSILNYGLLGRGSLEKLTDKPIFNDAYRFDGYPEAICLSISFPNYRMFYKLNSANQKEWVILTLEPYILWEFDCAFFEGNAASNSSKNIALLRRREYSSLVQMFMDYRPNARQDLMIPEHYTTNPQAEVLVLEPIPPSYIGEIHFCDKAVMESWLDEHGKSYSQRFLVRHEYFTPRVDWRKWKTNDTKIPQPILDVDQSF